MTIKENVKVYFVNVCVHVHLSQVYINYHKKLIVKVEKAIGLGVAKISKTLYPYVCLL